MPNIFLPILTLSLSLFSLGCFAEERESFQDLALFEVINDDDEDEVYCISKDAPLLERKKKEFEWNLAIAAVFQDEAEWLKEWIEYHKLVGVEHFLLYNNLSTDDFMSVLKPYLDSGEVELFDWPYAHQEDKEGFWVKIQTDALKDAIERSKESVKWLAIIDTDEFLVPIKHSTITDLLLTYEKIIPKLSQVSIKWVMFGTSDVLKVPDDKLMIEVLTKNAGREEEGLYKSIVKPKDVIECGNTHYCDLVKKRWSENISYAYAQINHYWTRDEFYLNQVKVPRREKIGYKEEIVLSWSESYNVRNEETALPIRRFISALRMKMGME